MFAWEKHGTFVMTVAPSACFVLRAGGVRLHIILALSRSNWREEVTDCLWKLTGLIVSGIRRFCCGCMPWNEY